ncbi:hypothetical protein [Mucilaginibacter flavus]|uniref:hypothetical protein n=1 Tax=Mucilaginibacter flavus TaxID=931504 RepID=UPI0025B5AAE1|nr:hypothetical protein [Mucilaginibacter flavus]MDN3584375.1 hypothetical protein [Mucilaginibacter flavus]
MKKIVKLLIVSTLFTSCVNSDEGIKTLLQSKTLDDQIEGACKAGESGKMDFIPYLLMNADDPRVSTDLRYKGFSVYQEKMIAIKTILKIGPPKTITREPDSTIIQFYVNAASKYINN